VYIVHVYGDWVKTDSVHFVVNARER